MFLDYSFFPIKLVLVPEIQCLISLKILITLKSESSSFRFLFPFDLFSTCFSMMEAFFQFLYPC